MKPTGIHIAGELNNCALEVLNDHKKLEQLINDAITDSGMKVEQIISHAFEPIGVTITAIISESHVVIHTYPEAEHASVDIYTCTYNPKPPRRLFDILKKELNATQVKYIELFRGDILDTKETNLITTSSGIGFEIRYEIDNMILSKKTDYQQLDIIENSVFGRMLLLDNDLQIADSDAHIYNETMVAPSRKLNTINDILILGGGDGGIANQLLKETNSNITLVDIDQMVIEACKDHLTKVAGDAFNSERVNVINQDAEKYIQSINNSFDAIFYDLSMHPEIFSIKDKNTYLSDLFSSLKKILKNKGLLSMQCCSAYDQEMLNKLKDILPEFFDNIDYSEVFIPSFCEPWVFASASIK